MATRETKTIGGREYTFSRCSAVEAIDLELSLAKVGGSALATVDIATLLQAAGGNAVAMKAMQLQLADAIGAVAQRLTKEELLRLMGIVFGYVDCGDSTIGGDTKDINKVFADRPRDLWTVFIHALKVNLGPLGEGLPSISSATKSQAPSQ